MERNEAFSFTSYSNQLHQTLEFRRVNLSSVPCRNMAEFRLFDEVTNETSMLSSQIAISRGSFRLTRSSRYSISLISLFSSLMQTIYLDMVYRTYRYDEVFNNTIFQCSVYNKDTSILNPLTKPVFCCSFIV